MMNTVNHNDFGYVILNGVLSGVSTTGFTAGQTLYLSSSGDYTNIQPTAPRHTVRLGEVVTVGNSSTGVIFINISNGYEIGELHDVSASAAVNGDLLAYDSSTSIWKNTKTLSGSYTINGALTASNISVAGMQPYAYTRFVDMSGSDTIGDGSPSKPFQTIQKAIDSLGLPVNGTDEKNIRKVIVNGGIYNENLTIPAAGGWQMIANGHVTLGSGDGVFLSSTTKRNVVWINDQTKEFSQLRPSLTFSQAFSGIYAGSTHIAYNSTGWDITGNFTISSLGGAGGSTSTELVLNGVKIGGLLDASGKFGILNVCLEKCYLVSSSDTFNQSSTYIGYAKETEFDGKIVAGQLGHFERCDIGAGATYTSWINTVLPFGFFACQIAGTLTSGAGNYRADGTTQFLSPTVVLAGGNTLTDMQ
jgi:hypothetical protein